MSEQPILKTSAGQAAKAGLFGALGVMSAPLLIVIILLVLCCACMSIGALSGGMTVPEIPSSTPAPTSQKLGVSYDQVLKGMEDRFTFTGSDESKDYIGVDMNKNNTIQILGDKENISRVGLVFILDNTSATSQNVEITTTQVVNNIFTSIPESKVANEWITKAVSELATKQGTIRTNEISGKTIKVEMFPEKMTLRIDIY